MRGHPEDYNSLKDFGIEKWSWNDVFPIFLRSEDNLDVDTPDSPIEVSMQNNSYLNFLGQCFHSY